MYSKKDYRIWSKESKLNKLKKDLNNKFLKDMGILLYVYLHVSLGLFGSQQ